MPYLLTTMDSTFTRTSANGTRQRSRRRGFAAAHRTTQQSPLQSSLVSDISFSRKRLLASPRRSHQRSKRFRPRLPRSRTTICAELGPCPLLSVESVAPLTSSPALPYTPSTLHPALPSAPSPQALPSSVLDQNLCAELESHPLLPVESAALNYSLALPHSALFGPHSVPPARPNTAPRANAPPPVPNDLQTVPCRLNASAWAFYLEDYPDRLLVDTLIHIIKYGANIGFTGDRSVSQSCTNLRSALEHPDAVSNDIRLQLSNGCMIGPFANAPLSPLRCSPLGVATRKRSDKLRRIHHLSWPRNSSVNDGISDDEASIVYDSFHTAVSDLVRSGRGSLLVKLDLEQAFRHIPIRRSDWHLLGFLWEDQFYYDIVLAFGLRSAPYIFNLFSEALHWILARHLPASTRHFLDDFLNIFPPNISKDVVQSALEWCLALGTQLGLRFQPSKVEGPSTCLEYLGIILDSEKMEARLPSDKLSYLSTLLSSWATRTHCTLRELQELTGFLQFCSQVIPYSRAFLRALFDFMSSFSSPMARRRLPKSARRDIIWWCRFSSGWNGVHLIAPSRPEVHIFTDASGTKGAGGVFEHSWFSIRIPSRYTLRDIQFKELYAVVHAVLCWGPTFTGKHVIFHIDNQAVATAVNELSIRSVPTMELLRHFLLLCCQLDFTFESQWIPTEENPLADAASRFQYKLLFSLAPYLPLKPSPKVLSLPNLHQLTSDLNLTLNRPHALLSS